MSQTHKPWSVPETPENLDPSKKSQSINQNFIPPSVSSIQKENSAIRAKSKINNQMLSEDPAKQNHQPQKPAMQKISSQKLSAQNPTKLNTIHEIPKKSYNFKNHGK